MEEFECVKLINGLRKEIKEKRRRGRGKRKMKSSCRYSMK